MVELTGELLRLLFPDLVPECRVNGRGDDPQKRIQRFAELVRVQAAGSGMGWIVFAHPWRYNRSVERLAVYPIGIVDTLTPAERSLRMSLVRCKDTKPEMAVRRLVHGMGYRYRLHDRRLPGTPDLVFPARRKVIFIHGCFWHRHGCALGDRMPKSRLDFWKPKLDANRGRDARNLRALCRLGWDVLVLWECQLADHRKLAKRLRMFLD